MLNFLMRMCKLVYAYNKKSTEESFFKYFTFIAVSLLLHFAYTNGCITKGGSTHIWFEFDDIVCYIKYENGALLFL